ncbi:MFS transporter [Labedaea rhizosphaerae]|uniref:EmrB/QacA subfamily drug resistance transporter n=1 Tax=Labedaea rhizosphaerae TaxID=598644 RepID=A0A4V3CZG8_LABRH|nr:MFS transporter [Labedaea rhizosphaerae]TDP97968.1 EmrB/QacA subfamily drug resistance transporter [Labedaea rhizosphaerae]
MTTLTKPGTATARSSGRRMWAILALVLLADALDVIDSTVTNIAAPTIAGDLDGGVGLIKWLGTAYMLAMGVLLVVGGRLGDKFGQRRLFLIGMGGFTVASAVAGFAPDPALLIVARVAQGAFGALLIPQGMATMTKAFDRDMLAKAFGMFGPVLALSSVGGPILAGFLISADVFGLSWRPIFLINIILGVVGMIIAGRILPRDDDADRSTVVDGRASGLLAVTMIGVLYGLIEGSTNGWSAVPVASITIGVLFFAAFAHRQRTATHPLIKPSLLKNRGFTSGLLVCLVAVAAGTGLLFVLSLFLQEGLHVGARDASLGLLPITVGLVVAGFAAMGGLVVKLGRTLVFIGLAVDLVGCGWVLAFVADAGTNISLWTLAPAFIVIGVGIGLSFATIPVVALGDAKPDEAGSASGSFSSIQQLASAIGSAALTSIFFQAASSGLDHAMTVSLVVVLAVTALSIPVVALMPRKAPQEPGN